MTWFPAERLLGVTWQTDPDLDQPRPDQLHPFGCIARVVRMLKFPDDSVRVLIQGLKRMRVVRVEAETPYLQAQIAPVDDEQETSLELSALARNAANQFQEIINLSPSLPDELKVALVNIDDPGKLADVIAANLNIPLHEKQRLLEAVHVKARLTLLTNLLNREIEVLHLGSEIQSKVNSALSKSQREYFLREQLKAIQKELGDGAEQGSEVTDLRDKIDKAQMPAEVKKVAIKEADRLATMTPAAAEYTVGRSYLDWLIALPWSKSTDDKLDIVQAKRILDSDHYDLEPVKKRILEYLSVLKLRQRVDRGRGRERPHPVLRRPTGRRQNFVGPKHRPRPRSEVHPHIARWRAGRSGDSRTSPHVHRRLAGPRDPGTPPGREQQSRFHARRN